VSSNTTGGKDNFLFWMLYFQVQVSASGWSLVQRSSGDCGVSSECDSEPRHGKPRPGITSKRHRGGGIVGKPREIKEEEAGTDSYGVCALILLGWLWFRITFKGEL
jgi:hypothetical protein